MMKRKEAIELLKLQISSAEFFAMYTHNDRDAEKELKNAEAFRMAIEALSAEVVPKHDVEIIIDEITKRTSSTKVAQGDGRDNMKRYPNCQMRTSLGNCDAIGGFCTSINAPICDAFHKLVDATQDWIPVSEGLPDTDVPVLVSDGVYVWEDELQEDYEDGKTVYWWDSQCSFDFNDTAWMPKPKPYKRGGES